jgi:FtsH-binding integral membrane protein
MRTTFAEIYESWTKWLVIWVLLAGVESLAHALGYLYPSATEAFATVAGVMFWLRTLIMLVAGIAFSLRHTKLLWGLKGPRDLERRGRLRTGGYLDDVVRTASLVACMLTGCALAVLGIAAGDTQLPPAFFVKSALFVLCAAFGVTFFALDWYAARGDREAAAP